MEMVTLADWKKGRLYRLLRALNATKDIKLQIYGGHRASGRIAMYARSR
jgi:hypothetical protein